MVPTTVVVVEDRLPPNKAAVLVNKAHIDRDLVCFLDTEELVVFEAIDGATALADFEGANPALSERSWIHDLAIDRRVGLIASPFRSDRSG